jgi:thiol-disulfide isomerase/thioredoxin
MRVFLISIIILVVCSGATYPGGRVPAISLQQLQSSTQQQNDTLYIVNFWATWCRPCVAELPYFEKAASTYANKKLKILLVSVDGLREQRKVEAFVNARKSEASFVLLSEQRPNEWINAVDSSWTGAIPATVFYRQGQKLLFLEQEITEQELDSLIIKQVQ